MHREWICMYCIQTVCIQYILFVFNQHRRESIPILTYSNQYKPILANTSWMDLFVLYTNCLYSIHTVCIQTASLWIHTYSNLYRPLQTDTNQYIVNGLVCIESVFRKPIQIQYLYWPKQASIQTCINQNSSIHTNTSWIDWYVLNTNSRRSGAQRHPLTGAQRHRLDVQVHTNEGEGSMQADPKKVLHRRTRRIVSH